MKRQSGRTSVVASIGCSFPWHHRLLRVPEEHRAAALGLWVAATCYTRDEELDGFCPLNALDGFRAEHLVTWLIDVNLFARDEQNGVHGIRVLRYELWNETKAQIDRRLSQKDKRLRSDRDRKKHKTIPNKFQADSVRNRGADSVRNVGEGKGEGKGEIGSGSGEEIQDSEVSAAPGGAAPDRYRAAYEAGIVVATQRPYAVPRNSEGELAQAILKFARGPDDKPLRGQELLAWITAQATFFSHFFDAQGEDQRFWNERSPKGLLRWLNRGPQSGIHKTQKLGWDDIERTVEAAAARAQQADNAQERRAQSAQHRSPSTPTRLGGGEPVAIAEPRSHADASLSQKRVLP